MDKIAVFVDVQNIYYTCREAYQKSFNYRLLWQRLNEQGKIVIANAYAIHSDNDGQIKFQDALKHIGFDVKLKPFIQRADGTAKGDWDVGITIDIMESAPMVNKIILLSGDGDFAILVNKIREKYHVEVESYGVPQLTAKALMDAVTEYHPISLDLLR